MGSQKVIPVVVDTNVIISALLFGGKPGQLISHWKSGRIQPYISRSIIDELLRVLSYPKFELSAKEVEYLLYSEILPYFEVVEVKPGPTVVNADPTDDMFLHCAVKAGAAAIITGDRHLLALQTFEGIVILTPGQFLKSYLQFTRDKGRE